MKFIKNLFKSNKLNSIMEKLEKLLALDNHYNAFDESNTDSMERLALIRKAIDIQTDQFLETVLPSVETEENNEKKEASKEEKPAEKETKEEKDNSVEKDSEEETPKKEEKAPEEETSKEEKKDSNNIEDYLVQVPLVHPFSIEKADGTQKNIRIDGASTSLPAFQNEAHADKFDNKYPTVDVLDDILTKAWEMACMIEKNSDINDYLKKELGKYYNNIFTSNQSWYAISNTYRKAVKIIKKVFGENGNDPDILITRPVAPESGELILRKKFDMIKEEKTSKTEEPKEKEAPKKEEALETVQEAQDEEDQEKEDKEKAEEKEEDEQKEDDADVQNEEEVSETTEEVQNDEQSSDTTEAEASKNNDAEASTENPPKVNSYNNFTDLEEGIFEIMKDAEKKRRAETDPKKKKTIRKEARERVRILVSSFYDNQEWAQKSEEDGSWSTKLTDYTNDVINECAKHYDDEN